MVSRKENRTPMSPSDYNSDSQSERNDDNIGTIAVEQDQVVQASPDTRVTNSHQMVTPRAEESETDLVKENEALRTRLQKASRHFQMKQLINEKDELVMLRLRRYVKEQLWKKVKFITDDDVLERALNKCADQFGVDEKERYDWRQRMSREVQQSLNNRRNNCVNDLGEAFMSK